MGVLKIQRHGRIQEWVAEEVGAFATVGLDYEIPESKVNVADLPPIYHKLIDRDSPEYDSAYREFVVKSTPYNIASTSHWAVSTAIRAGYGERMPYAYSIMPAGIYVHPTSKIQDVSGLRGSQIMVGRHSGSHFSALHALEHFIPQNEIHLKFVAGRSKRLRTILDDTSLAGSIYGLEAYILEQQGFRKILDTTFMVSFMLIGQPPKDDVKKYVAALQIAQNAIDENPNKYKHYLVQDFPEDIRNPVNINACGCGEHIAFNTYSEDVLFRAQDWVARRGVFPERWINQ
jgi:NitT/TauT family transport system substrate-binding protein